MRRQQADAIGDIYQAILDHTWLGPAMQKIEVFRAWEETVGVRAAQATSNKFFRDGILHLTISSSVLRSQLYFRLDDIRRQINSKVTSSQDAPVRKIILK